MEAQNKVKRKGPGRPPKADNSHRLERKGVCCVPHIENHTMELVSDTPFVFKKLFGLFKTMSAHNITMNFESNYVEIFTDDHFQKNECYVKINASKLASYYCAQPKVIYITQELIYHIFKKIDKNYKSIHFYTKQDKEQTLHISLKNVEEIDEKHDIDFKLPNENQAMRASDFSMTGHELKFKLSSKYFKKLVNDISSVTDVLTISRPGGRKLSFTYNVDNSIRGKHICKNNDKITLCSNVPRDKSVFVTTKLDYIKPLSSSILSDYIDIAVHSERDLLFHMSMEERTFEVTIKTKIINTTLSM